MFRSEIFDFFPAPGTSRAAGDDDPEGFADWAMDVFPALLEADVPFYSHEIDAYWNDIGNLAELRQGNLDALSGAVAVEPGAPEVADGVRSASPLDGVEVSGPALIGAGVELGEGVRIDGPAIVGDGCRIGDGAYVGATRSCSKAPSCRPGRWPSAASAVASQSPDAFLTNGAPRVRRGAGRVGRMSLLDALATVSCRRSAPPAGASAGPGGALRALRRGGSPRRSRCAAPGPPGVDRAWSSAPHEGVARDLVVALKFRRLLPVAGADGRPDPPAGCRRRCCGGEVVPVPTAPLRSLARGFDPAAEIAAALAERAGVPLRADCLRRAAARPPGRPAPGRAARPAAADRGCAARRRAASCSSTTC